MKKTLLIFILVLSYLFGKSQTIYQIGSPYLPFSTNTTDSSSNDILNSAQFKKDSIQSSHIIGIGNYVDKTSAQTVSGLKNLTAGVTLGASGFVVGQNSLYVFYVTSIANGALIYAPTQITNSGFGLEGGTSSSKGNIPLLIKEATSSVVVQGATSQTGDLFQWQNSSKTVLAKVDASGNLTAPSFIKSGGTSSQYLMADGSTTTSAGGGSLSNIGSGYKLAVAGTNNVKTLFGKNGVTIDSTSNTNGLTISVDSTQIYAAKGIKADTTLNPGFTTLVLDSAYQDSSVRAISKPTLQDALTNGSSLTTNNSINVNSNDFYILGGATGQMGFVNSSSGLIVNHGDASITGNNSTSGVFSQIHVYPDSITVHGNSTGTGHKYLPISVNGNYADVNGNIKSIDSTVTLSGGTKTVSDSRVKTGARIFVSVNTPGGTQGFLSAKTSDIVNGTSFIINSTSATETSTVNYEIINP